MSVTVGSSCPFLGHVQRQKKEIVFIWLAEKNTRLNFLKNEIYLFNIPSVHLYFIYVSFWASWMENTLRASVGGDQCNHASQRKWTYKYQWGNLPKHVPKEFFLTIDSLCHSQRNLIALYWGTCPSVLEEGTCLNLSSANITQVDPFVFM